MEFLIVMAFTFLLIIPLVLFFGRESKDAVEDVNLAQVTQLARSLSNNAENVYAFGEPTSVTIRVYIPDGVENVTFGNGEILFTMIQKGEPITISEPVSMNISGSLNTGPGVHRIQLQAVGGAVVIGEVS